MDRFENRLSNNTSVAAVTYRMHIQQEAGKTGLRSSDHVDCTKI